MWVGHRLSVTKKFEGVSMLRVITGATQPSARYMNLSNSLPLPILHRFALVFCSCAPGVIDREHERQQYRVGTTGSPSTHGAEDASEQNGKEIPHRKARNVPTRKLTLCFLLHHL